MRCSLQNSSDHDKGSTKLVLIICSMFCFVLSRKLLALVTQNHLPTGNTIDAKQIIGNHAHGVAAGYVHVGRLSCIFLQHCHLHTFFPNYKFSVTWQHQSMSWPLLVDKHAISAKSCWIHTVFAVSRSWFADLFQRHSTTGDHFFKMHGNTQIATWPFPDVRPPWN